MPKETYYFPHDYSATTNPKISAMLQDYKAEGYGIFWHLIELLHQNDDHKLPLKKYIYSAIAKQMLTSVEQVSKFIKDCIEEYELLYLEDGYFYSDRVHKNIEKRTEISEKRSLAGKKSQEYRKQNSTLVEQVQSNAQQNSTKEKKVKETTIESSVRPAINDVLLYFDENGYSEQSARSAFTYYDDLNWNNKFGKAIINWKITMSKNWFKPESLKPKSIMPNEKTNKIDHSNMDLKDWQ